VEIAEAERVARLENSMSLELFFQILALSTGIAAIALAISAKS
jgi:hypothetical protein